MAGNARGKLKEHLEGVHRDNEWAKHHISGALSLIPDKTHPLVEGLEALASGYTTLDELAQDIYSKI
jgi:hypothetical protein